MEPGTSSPLGSTRAATVEACTCVQRVALLLSPLHSVGLSSASDAIAEHRHLSGHCSPNVMSVYVPAKA